MIERCETSERAGRRGHHGPYITSPLVTRHGVLIAHRPVLDDTKQRFSTEHDTGDVIVTPQSTMEYTSVASVFQ